MKTLILLLCCTVVLAACSSVPVDPSQQEQGSFINFVTPTPDPNATDINMDLTLVYNGDLLNGYGPYHDVFRFIDVDAGVVCYLSESARGIGLSCLPLADTYLLDDLYQ
jgi:hypothetical protein